MHNTTDRYANSAFSDLVFFCQEVGLHFIIFSQVKHPQNLISDFIVRFFSVFFFYQVKISSSK